MGENIDFQSNIEVISKIVDIISKITEIGSKIDVKLWVGILSLGGVFYTVYSTRKNVNRTNNLKQELENQSNNLKKELANQTNEITKDLGEKNLKALEQRRYIDAISVERIKWINNLRDSFSDFLKNVNLHMSDIYKLDKEKQEVDVEGTLEKEKQEVDVEKMRERLGEIIYIGNHIYLLLNPTEPICKEIRILQNQIFKSLEKFNVPDFDYKKVNDLIDKLSFYYQVVLKAEWKRVKKENKRGKEIDKKAMDSIYKETLAKIGAEAYDNEYSKTES
ncbi:hypothetical protein ACWKS0_19045 [Bacillus cereus]